VTDVNGETLSERPEPPEPPGLPLVGQTHAFLRDPLACYERWTDIDDVVSVRIGGRRFCLVSHPADVERVLVTDAPTYEKGTVVTEQLGSLLGESVFLLEGDAWRERRRALQPPFERAEIRADGDLTTRWAADAVDSWPTDRPIRVDERLADLSLSILAQSLFGIDVRGERTAIHATGETVMDQFDMRSPSTFLPEWVPTPRNLRYRRAVARLEADIADRIDDRDGTGDDLLSHLVSLGLPRERIRDELITFLFAGYESTATTMAVLLHQLAAKPHVQDRVAAELDATVDGARPTVDDLDRLPTLEAALDETLRLYPSQYAIFREPQAAVELGGYHVPAGTTVVLPSLVVHRDPRFWAHPDEFRPRRWQEDGPSDRPEYAYFPFGGGPRHCLGMRMARQMIELVVATAVHQRRFATDDDLSMRAGPTLQPVGGVTVTSEHRSE
jgi:cytochrome P450